MTMILAHRGSKGTHPENTLAAFQEAIRVGADGIELDVHLSKDGHLMVIHDETVDRTTNGSGDVGSFTLHQLKQLDAGSWFTTNPLKQEIPTLEEVLLFLVENDFSGLLNIEIKTDTIHYEGIEATLTELMQSRDWPFQYMYSSFHFASLQLMSTLEPRTRRGLITHAAAAEVAHGLTSLVIDDLHPKMAWVETHLAELKTITKPLRPWTVNEPALMEQCFDYELAGFHTDFPEKACEVRRKIKSKG